MAHEVRYTVNADDDIVFVNEAWDTFAQENGAAHLTSTHVLGRSLWDFVTDDTTRLLYRDVLARIRGTTAMRFTFRCDAPACRRHLELEVTGGRNGDAVFLVRTLKEEPRPAQPLLDPAQLRSDALLRMCSWCKRIDVNGHWVDVEEAVTALGLFDRPRLPQVTHGICDDCYARMAEAIAQAS